jgi:hypothetical protein
MLRLVLAILLPGLGGCVGALRTDPAGAAVISLEVLGTYRAGGFMSGAAEIVAYDRAAAALVVVNADKNALDVLSIADPRRPHLLRSIDLAPYGAGVNSVDVHPDGGVLAAAVEAAPKTDSGRVVIFSTDGDFLAQVSVGALPDMLTFTPDGRRLLVANEGEPSDDYANDPEGSVSVIAIPPDPRDLSQSHVRTADFRRFDAHGIPEGVRVFGPHATVPQDLEPEYIAVTPDSRTAFVTLQENNALAVVDLDSATVERLIPLGVKNHALPGSGLDASDRDGRIRIEPAPVQGMYQPDTIKSFRAGGRVLLATADEGDPRSYAGFEESVRVRDLVLDPDAFPDAADLQRDDQLGRLKVSRVEGDPDADGRHEHLVAFGGRGFTIRDTLGRQVFESGDALERMTARHFADGFNSDNQDLLGFDTRSDDRGPEPEALAVGRVNGRVFVFVGLERTGGIAVFDATIPEQTVAAGFFTNRVYGADHHAGQAGDLGPECLLFIPGEHSPTGDPLLVSANEVSATVTIYRVR